MGYLFPPKVAQVVSAAHVAGSITTQVIAAPGAGLALRIVGGIVSVNKATAGGTSVDEFLFDGIVAVRVWTAGNLNSNSPRSALIIPAPGIQLTVNQPLNLVSQSTAATGNSIALIHYFIDTVI